MYVPLNYHHHQDMKKFCHSRKYVYAPIYSILSQNLTQGNI